jgi:hypothetical protein
MPKGNVLLNLGFGANKNVEESRLGSKEKGIGFSKNKYGYYKTTVGQSEDLKTSSNIRARKLEEQEERAEKKKKPWPKDAVGPDSMSQKDWIEHEIERVKRKSGR